MIVDHTQLGAAFRRLSIPVAVQMLGDQLLGVVDTIAIGSLGTVALGRRDRRDDAFPRDRVRGLRPYERHVDRRRAADRRGATSTASPARCAPARSCRSLAVGSLRGRVCLVSRPRDSRAWSAILPSAHASAIYLILRCASIVPIVISGTLIVGLGAAGNRQLGILVLIVVNLVHIPLLMMLGLGWWTHHPFGIVGAGISSLLSETIAAVYARSSTSRGVRVYRIFSQLHDHRGRARASARALGLPEAIFLLRRARARHRHRRDARTARRDRDRGVSRAQRRLRSHLRRAEPAAERDANRHRPAARRAATPPGAHGFSSALCASLIVITSLTGASPRCLAWPLAYVFHAQRDGRHDRGASARRCTWLRCRSKAGRWSRSRRSARRATRGFR